MHFFRRYRLVDSLLLLALATALIWPLFRINYLEKWPSIESTFISDARLLAEHMPHPSWQPLWYCGVRFDYIYPPALRYGTALISLVAHTSTARAYHIYVGMLYVVGIVSVYWLVVIGSNSRVCAWLSAVSVALLSPCVALVRTLAQDDPWMIPQRLHALVEYGEGPHISALSILPAALAAAFVALRSWRPAALALAAVLCAFTVANNFYGATALAVFFPIAVWSVWLGWRDRFVWVRAMAIVVLAYGLSAFWLTPSYIRVTLADLKYVSKPGDWLSQVFLVGIIFAFREVSYRWADRRPDRTWPVFVTGSVLLLSVAVLGNFYFGWRVLGEPSRLAPEFDMVVLIFLVLLISSLWKVRRLRFDAVALAIVIFIPAFTYLRHVYEPFVPSNNWQDRYERRITKWVHENLPDERVMPSGEVRLWFDAWYDDIQADGGSDQGLINQLVPAARFQLGQPGGDISVLWLQALGVSAIIVPDRSSPDFYHDYQNPKKFQGLLPVILDDGRGTVVYRVPRIYKSIGRVVDRSRQETIGELNFEHYTDALKQYVSIIEAPQPETSVVWRGFEALKIGATVGQGQSVLLQETYDPAWHAYENGKPLSIRMDRVMGFMLIDVAPGLHAIDVRFETPLENRVGWFLFMISLLVVVGLSAGPRWKLLRGMIGRLRSLVGAV